VAAEVKVWADVVWAGIEKDKTGRVERIKCWDVILSDPKISGIVGRGSVADGRA